MRRLLLWSGLAGIIGLVVAALVLYQLTWAARQPQNVVRLEIKQGTSLSRVAQDLETSGVINSAFGIKLVARLQRPGQQIQAGTYLFNHAATPVEVLDRLIRGDVEKVSLTIPEGFTLDQVLERIAAAGFGDLNELRRLAHDSDFIISLQLEGDSLEGYLFPETYVFAPGIDERAILTMFVNEYRRILDPSLLADAVKVGLNPRQLVILASIIEKETGEVSEMPLISSVFHNRLKRRIPLQTDPTVIYGIENFDGNLTRKHLITPSPYNTYLNRGLPPGPIANPGLAALMAAARPATTKYLYFVARGDGTHQFSRTLVEHNAAVRKYQLRRKR